MNYNESNYILTEQKQGSRSRQSSESQLLITVDEVAKSMALEDQVDIVLFNWQSANDSYTTCTYMASEETHGIGPRTF